MAKVEELNKSMGPAYKIADQVKDVKRLLDLFEIALNSKQSDDLNVYAFYIYTSQYYVEKIR